MSTSKSSTNNRKPIRSQRSRVKGAVHIFRYHSCCVPTNYNHCASAGSRPHMGAVLPAGCAGNGLQVPNTLRTANRTPFTSAGACRGTSFKSLRSANLDVSQKCCRAKLGLRLGGCVGAHRLLTASFNLRNRTSRGLWPVRSRYIVKACGHPRQSATPNNASVGRASNIAWATDFARSQTYLV